MNSLAQSARFATAPFAPREKICYSIPMPRTAASRDARKLLILGCSDLKRHSDGPLPALDRYDGPAYRVLRKFLRERLWPSDLSIAVLSAKHGLFGIFKNIEDYNKRMDSDTARLQAPACTRVLESWAQHHKSIHISLGQQYLPALQPAIDQLEIEPTLFHGAIGHKLSQVKNLLANSISTPRNIPQIEAGTGQYRYFLPDWDDVLDPNFDFETDKFSAPARSQRDDKHCAVLTKPQRLSDGVLLSLAQCEIQKGLLKRPQGTGVESLSPPPIRQHFGLEDDQYLFGDCGAFSYVDSEEPALSVDRAVALYESYGFDFGAAVDHIPMAKIVRGGEVRELSKSERLKRIEITSTNAADFITSAQQRKAKFLPVAILHGLDPEGYSSLVRYYYDLGYRHIAIGGLVPRADKQVADVVTAVMKSVDDLPERPWMHLFGIYRPKLQQLFRSLRIDSFDSATYFRKAWLRSDQNYLGADGEWYAAIRVPMTTDGRTLRKLEHCEIDIEELREEESSVLSLLSSYGREEAGIEEVLEAILGYDAHLTRNSESGSMREKYRRTLEKRPWEACDCNFCRDIGIHMLIFRGANRNRRRGAHNTLQLYESLSNGGEHG